MLGLPLLLLWTVTGRWVAACIFHVDIFGLRVAVDVLTAVEREADCLSASRAAATARVTNPSPRAFTSLHRWAMALVELPSSARQGLCGNLTSMSPVHSDDADDGASLAMTAGFCRIPIRVALARPVRPSTAFADPVMLVAVRPAVVYLVEIFLVVMLLSVGLASFD